MVDPSKLAFSSAFRYEYIGSKGSKAFTVVGGGFGVTTVTIPHNLGYKPYFKAFYTYGDGKYYQLFAGIDSYDVSGNGGQIDNVTIDATNLVIIIDNFAVPAISGTIYYRIYSEVIT